MNFIVLLCLADTATCSNLWGDVKCNEWAERAECEANPMWMKEYCKKACSICSNMHSEDDGEKDCETLLLNHY